MSLDLRKTYKHANPYNTNWFYLHNMTSLQLKAINRINSIKSYKEIHTGLWYVPWAFSNEEYAKNSMERFISDLNKELMGL